MPPRRKSEEQSSEVEADLAWAPYTPGFTREFFNCGGKVWVKVDRVDGYLQQVWLRKNYQIPHYNTNVRTFNNIHVDDDADDCKCYCTIA
jgi:hypothetical protein